MSTEKENTFRALSDQPLLATHQSSCRLGIHAWYTWKDPVINRRGVYNYIEQFRSCGHCGRAQRRVLSQNVA